MLWLSEGEGADVLDEGVMLVVVVCVVVLLTDLLPPHPTANTSMAALPNRASAVLARDFIRPPSIIVRPNRTS